MQPTLLILAAGMASRYGGMKQVENFGPSGETIMDYSIYDALRAGFKKVVFIIRKDFADSFEPIFNEKLNGKAEVAYVYQSLEKFTNGYPYPAERTKPWGTAHAVLCAKEVINEPYAVINADDFYGRDAFEKAFQFLTQECSEKRYGLIGYNLSNTLSDYGSVNRGVCDVDASGFLTSVTERIKIEAKEGRVVFGEGDEMGELDKNAVVSMNFWCFHQQSLAIMEEEFAAFLKADGQELKSEFFIPVVADDFIKNKQGQIDVVPTNSLWFGVTYKEDAPEVKRKLNELISAGEYPTALWV